VSWTQSWINRGRGVAERRRQLYGLDVPEALTRILAREEGRLGALDTFRLLAFIAFGSHRGRLTLLYKHLADLDTPRKARKIESLAGALGEKLSPRARLITGHFERRCYSRDLGRIPSFLEKLLFRTTPTLVAQPGGEEDIARILAFAAERQIAVLPRGVSSSAFGGVIPTRGGIVLDLSRMTEILEISPAALSARVQPGVRWGDLAITLDRVGLAPVTTPSSRFSTIGGWAATGGVGMESYGFGPFSESIRSARIALPGGDIIARHAENDGLRDFVGTEGQLGVFTELTIDLKRKPALSSPRVFHFQGVAAAFAFLRRVIDARIRPSHVVLFDRERMVEENHFFHDRTGLAENIVEETETVLLHFDDPDQEARLLEAAGPGLSEAPAACARYLWSERYFPLKAQRLGSGLLAAEIVLGARGAPAYIEKARSLAERFGPAPSIEAIFSRTHGGEAECAIIASFLCDPRRKLSYLLHMAVVQLLVRLGARMGGRPYGIGIWNTPFLRARYSPDEMRRLEARKRETDPHSLLNPNKFFRIRTRFFGIPGLLFRPAFFDAALGLLSLLSPVLGRAVRPLRGPASASWRVPAPQAGDGRGLLEESSLRCTYCGSCVSVCPAYQLTGEELVTGRAKLRMAEWLAAREPVAPREALRHFQCIRCGLCEEVCQTRLPLRDCYLVLEGWVERQHGRPVELIRDFLGRVDESQEWITTAFGLDQPEWSPAARAGSKEGAA
jgi:FAD/FMN-containing dehydrogenase/ferredoxin